MKNKLISLFFSILLLTSFFTPVVNAAPQDGREEPELGIAQFLLPAAAPEACEIIIAGMTVIISGSVVVEIGKHLGEIWDKTLESWDRFVKSVSAGLDRVFAAKNWVKITSPEGKGAMQALFECFCADVPPGSGKKDDKWYFEARRSHGKVEINTERLTEEQAVKEMGRGKNIMTLNEKLAAKIVEQFANTGKVGRWIDMEIKRPHHENDPEYYYHLHYGRNRIEHLHCWIWRYP